MNLERALRISVRSSVIEADLRWLAEAAGSCERILELGSYHGRSALAMLDNSAAHLWCVDSWCSSGRRTKITKKDHQVFLDNVAVVRDRITVLEMFTVDAAKQLQHLSFDMIFIDADHSYEAARADITNYLPLLRSGGLMCGHDYNKNHPGVVRAVNEVFKDPHKGGAALWWARREEGWLFTRQPTN